MRTVLVLSACSALLGCAHENQDFRVDDNSGLIESWRQRGLSEERISQGQREGTMGYVDLTDPTTGTNYAVPLEAYDGTVGGYRNPVRPDEILVPVTP